MPIVGPMRSFLHAIPPDPPIHRIGRGKPRQIWFIFGTFLMLLIPPSVALAQSSPCDPHLLQPTQNPYSYRLRGDRCEGIYIQEVSGAPLLIASWTVAFSDYDLASDQPIVLEWGAFSNDGMVHLRAQALRRRLYYRMDALRPPSSKSYTWPFDLVSALRISKPELGITGITRGAIEGVERDVYLPLRVSQGAKPAGVGRYQLVLLPGVELKELFLTLTALTGDKPTVVKDGEAVGYGYYPAERPIEIPISVMQGRGFYHLEIGATLRSSGASATELWFYHPGS